MSLTSYRAAPPRAEERIVDGFYEMCELQCLAATYSSIA